MGRVSAEVWRVCYPLLPFFLGFLGQRLLFLSLFSDLHKAILPFFLFLCPARLVSRLCSTEISWRASMVSRLPFLLLGGVLHLLDGLLAECSLPLLFGLQQYILNQKIGLEYICAYNPGCSHRLRTMLYLFQQHALVCPFLGGFLALLFFLFLGGLRYLSNGLRFIWGSFHRLCLLRSSHFVVGRASWCSCGGFGLRLLWGRYRVVEEPIQCSVLVIV